MRRVVGSNHPVASLNVNLATLTPVGVKLEADDGYHDVFSRDVMKLEEFGRLKSNC
jgi:hypothetical protein